MERKYVLAHFAKEIRSARTNKGLSQRELSKKTDIPQGHISNIENGRVDLKTSSLIEILRVLDLELMVIPRQLVPIIRGLQDHSLEPSRASESIPAYRIDGDEGGE